MKYLNILLVVILSILSFSGCKEDNCYWQNKPDAVSEASSKYYYEQGMIKGEKLAALLSNPFTWKPETVFTISTVRCDGTPNIAILMPLLIEEKTLLISGTQPLTIKNIRATKYARAMLRTTDPGAKSEFNPVGTIGCRLLLKLVEDEKEKKRLYEKYKAMMKDKARGIEQANFLKIVEIYPIG